MKGQNEVWISGNVGGKFITGTTREGEAACSFSLLSEDDSGFKTAIRLNVYGDLAKTCREKVFRGSYLLVVGELMNREGKFGELTEIRAKDIVFLGVDAGQKDKGNNHGERHEKDWWDSNSTTTKD